MAIPLPERDGFPNVLDATRGIISVMSHEHEGNVPALASLLQKN